MAKTGTPKPAVRRTAGSSATSLEYRIGRGSSTPSSLSPTAAPTTPFVTKCMSDCVKEMKLRASQQSRTTSKMFAVPASAWDNLDDSDNEDDGEDAEPESVQSVREEEIKEASAPPKSGLASLIYSSDPLQSISTNGGLQGSNYSGNTGPSASRKASVTRATHQSSSGSGSEPMTSPSAPSDSRSDTNDANQPSSNALPATADKPDWSYIMSRFGAPRHDASPQGPAGDDDPNLWETTDDGEDYEDEEDHPPVAINAAPIPEPADRESTEYPIVEDSGPPAIERSVSTARVPAAPSTISPQREISLPVVTAARLPEFTTTTGVDVSRVIEADQKTIARLKAQVEAFESREQDQDNPLFTGIYKRKIRDLTVELQKSNNKYVALDQQTKRLRDDEPSISSTMSAVRQMLPYTPLPSRTSKFIDRLGVKAMDLASEVQESKVALKEATDDFAARHDPEEKDPVARSQVHRLKVSNERLEIDNQNLRKLMIDHLTTFREKACDDKETILLGEEEIESLKAQVESFKAQIERKDLQIAQQTTQIKELVSECTVAKEHFVDNAEVAYAAIANFESLSKLQTWMATLTMFLFSIVPWGPVMTAVGEVRGVPAPAAVEEDEETTTASSTWTYRLLKFVANNMLQLDENTDVTNDEVATPSTNTPISTPRPKPTRAQDRHLRNKGKLINELEMSYGFPKNLPVKESPVMQFLRIISPAGILSIAEGLLVLLVSSTLVQIFLYSTAPEIQLIGQISIVNHFPGSSPLMVDLWNTTTSPEVLTIHDLGDPDLWLKIEILEDPTYEPEDNEVAEVVNAIIEPAEILMSPESTLPELTPASEDASNEQHTEPIPDPKYEHTWIEIARKGLHLAVLGVGGWRDLYLGANR
ncbi:hypothetical protein IFR05_001637 [Cadophora sp. M221]|nr:hypothetical protein IFR05_001637 [Cadophora sp. M221]